MCIVDNFCAPTVSFADALLKFYRVMYVFEAYLQRQCAVHGFLIHSAYGFVLYQ